MIKAIVAYNKNFVIGDSKGEIPWKIKDDMVHFKKVTMGCPVIMGRRTYLTLPERFRPLPGRVNIICSRNINKYIRKPEYIPEGKDPPLWCSSIKNAIIHAQRYSESVFIIGGGQIYQQAIEEDLVDAVIASEVKGYEEVDGAVFFPNLKELGWKGELKESFDEFDVVEYVCYRERKK